MPRRNVSLYISLYKSIINGTGVHFQLCMDGGESLSKIQNSRRIERKKDIINKPKKG